MRIRSTLLVLLLAGLGPTARADVVNSWVASRGVDGPGQVCGYGDAACNRCGPRESEEAGERNEPPRCDSDAQEEARREPRARGFV